jgi:hypothetical protein
VQHRNQLGSLEELVGLASRQRHRDELISW